MNTFKIISLIPILIALSIFIFSASFTSNKLTSFPTTLKSSSSLIIMHCFLFLYFFYKSSLLLALSSHRYSKYKRKYNNLWRTNTNKMVFSFSHSCVAKYLRVNIYTTWSDVMQLVTETQILASLETCLICNAGLCQSIFILHLPCF